MGPELSNLGAAQNGIRRAFGSLPDETPPPFPYHYSQFVADMEHVRGPGRRAFSPWHWEAFADPFTRPILPRRRFDGILSVPRSEGCRALGDATLALLHAADTGPYRPGTRAMQAVVNDLYDGFLSREDRRRIGMRLDRCALPPLVKWGLVGRERAIPYFVGEESLRRHLGVGIPVLSFPIGLARWEGLPAWVSASHEYCGHAILSAYGNLLDELRAKALRALGRGRSGDAGYWAPRLEEILSDVLSVLNLGPAAALGFLVGRRGANAAAGSGSRLSGTGDGEHPSDILRASVMSAVVGLLEFRGAQAWRARLDGEIGRDLPARGPRPRDTGGDWEPGIAEDLARAVSVEPLDCWNGKSLADIQNWKDEDERRVRRLRLAMRKAAGQERLDASRIDLDPGDYAAHALAAAVTGMVGGGTPDPGPRRWYAAMVAVLNRMADGCRMEPPCLDL